MQADFEGAYPDHQIRFKKLLPAGSQRSPFASAPVKRLKFIRRDAPTDRASRYMRGYSGDPIDIELQFKARRSGSLGFLGDIASAYQTDGGGMLVHDGIRFDRAVADIKIGHKIRPVHLLGDSSDAGVIDLTDVKRGGDGHPDFSSIAAEAEDLLVDFDKSLGGDRL